MSASFLHREPDFFDLVQLVAIDRQLPPALVEKDYWVSFCLGELIRQGWSVSFKGGTSLSKGYGIIKRFSEDLDLKLEPPQTRGNAAAINWKSQGQRATVYRRAYFDKLVQALHFPDCQVVEELRDDRNRSVHVRVEYPSTSDDLPAPLKSGVLLEVGHARVTPSEARAIDSWVAQRARAAGLEASAELQPTLVDCVLPSVTLLEKLDAVARAYDNPDRSAASFVRHYEDVAAIIRYLHEGGDWSALRLRSLYEVMLNAKDVRQLDFDAAAFVLPKSERSTELESAWHEAASLHWGERVSLPEVAELIREFVRPALVVG